MYAVVEDTPIVAEGDGVLSWLALALSNKETSVDPATQRQLRLCPGDVAMEPGVLLQTVHLGDVRGRDPAHLILGVSTLAPITILTLACNLELFPFVDGELSGLVSAVVVFGYIDVRVIGVILSIQEVVKRVPPVVLREGISRPLSLPSVVVTGVDLRGVA